MRGKRALSAALRVAAIAMFLRRVCSLLLLLTSVQGGIDTRTPLSSNFPDNPGSPYTYAFVIGGINPAKPAYRGMLYGVLVATFTLKRNHGSKADFVLFVQMSSEANETSDLTATEQRVLRDMDIQLRYIPRSETQSFHEITMNKFIILSLEQYRRVLFLDADILPVNNLDYLFEASDGNDAYIKKNFVVATAGEPANAGFFMLAPEKGDYNKALQIIAAQKESGKDSHLKAKFDIVNGWGHKIIPPDQWETTRRRGVTSRGTNWTFYCAPSDQGFLYHWTKYVKMSVSVQVREEVKSFGAANGTVRLEQVLQAPFRKTKLPNVLDWSLKNEWHGCKRKHFFECEAPHRDYVHLAGGLKPWTRTVPDGALTNSSKQSEYHYWFNLLSLVNQEFGVGIDFERWEHELITYKTPPLGWKPHYYKPKCTGCVIE